MVMEAGHHTKGGVSQHQLNKRRIQEARRLARKKGAPSGIHSKAVDSKRHGIPPKYTPSVQQSRRQRKAERAASRMDFPANSPEEAKQHVRENAQSRCTAVEVLLCRAFHEVHLASDPRLLHEHVLRHHVHQLRQEGGQPIRSGGELLEFYRDATHNISIDTMKLLWMPNSKKSFSVKKLAFL